MASYSATPWQHPTSLGICPCCWHLDQEGKIRDDPYDHGYGRDSANTSVQTNDVQVNDAADNGAQVHDDAQVHDARFNDAKSNGGQLALAAAGMASPSSGSVLPTTSRVLLLLGSVLPTTSRVLLLLAQHVQQHTAVDGFNP
jgi:hypothetical protein